VIHVHSFLGGHSSGTFQEIISAAKANELQFVIMTEHTEKDFDTSAMTLRGMHAGVLFVNGNEVSADNGDRSLVIPGAAIKIIAYPQEIKNWETSGITGVEVFNVYTNARQINPVVAFFDVLWSRRSYPDLVFALYYDRPNENLRLWDQKLAQATATAGNDAHANIGVSLRDNAGKTLAGIQLDPYEVSFRLVRMHVLIERNEPLNENNLLNALRAGHCFIGFDFLGDTSGFSFTAEREGEQKIQGNDVKLAADTRLKVRTPVSSQIKLFKDGNVIADETGVSSKDFPVTDRGVYRVEVYLPQLGKLVTGKPWIISNSFRIW
jgi:hypothetical protein